MDNLTTNAAPAATTTNKVYSNHDDGFRSRHIYFYYMRADHDLPNVDVYHIVRGEEVSPAQMVEEIRKILAEIRGTNPPPILGHKFLDVEWTHTSYFAAVLEGDEKLVAGNAFVFRFLGPQGGGGNHSFFGGVDIEEVEPNLSGFFCINHMLDENGNPLGDKRETFRVIANHPHSHAELGSVEPLYFSHNDSGTNTGPPQP